MELRDNCSKYVCEFNMEVQEKKLIDPHCVTLCVSHTHSHTNTRRHSWLLLAVAGVLWAVWGSEWPPAEARVSCSREGVGLQTCLGWINHARWAVGRLCPGHKMKVERKTSCTGDSFTGISSRLTISGLLFLLFLTGRSTCLLCRC